jgi:peptidoglycan LD-endopeptidase CwlK
VTKSDLVAAVAVVSRSLDDLDPSLRPVAADFLKRASDAGIDVLVTCTFRNDAAQAGLYAKGRTVAGRISTNAAPGMSKHNKKDAQGNPAALAFDVVPMRNGKPVWGVVGSDGLLWRRLGDIGLICGLRWAGNWKGSLREFPHFEK